MLNLYFRLCPVLIPMLYLMTGMGIAILATIYYYATGEMPLIIHGIALTLLGNVIAGIVIMKIPLTKIMRYLAIGMVVMVALFFLKGLEYGVDVLVFLIYPHNLIVFYMLPYWVYLVYTQNNPRDLL